VRALQDGAARLLDRGQRLDAESRHDLERLRADATLITLMTESLLEYLKELRLPVNPRHLDLAPVVSSVWADLHPATHPAELVLGALPACRADEHLARIVCRNLLDNALKYSARVASPRVEVGGVHHNSCNVYFVRDNGVGFDASQARRLFEPFGRLHGGNEFAGTGLGLASVRRIVERHGGQVWADARPGEGATFYFTLPAASAAGSRGQ
jgi:signal transduction histidine kinase